LKTTNSSKTLKRKLSDFQKDTEMGFISNGDSSTPNSPILEVARQIKRMRFQCRINVKLLNGRLIQLDVDSSQTVESLKQLLFQSEGIPIEQQKLLFNGKQLVSGSLELSDLHDDATIFLVLALPSRSGFSGISAAHRKDWRAEDDNKKLTIGSPLLNPQQTIISHNNNNNDNNHNSNNNNSPMKNGNSMMINRVISSIDENMNNKHNNNNTNNNLVSTSSVSNSNSTFLFSLSSNKKQRINNGSGNSNGSGVGGGGGGGGGNDGNQYNSSPNVQMTEQ